MNWYEWDSIQSFNDWHDAIKLQLGYPMESINQATGEIDPDAQQTTDYTKPFEIAGKIIAMVEDQHAIDLVATDLRYEPNIH